MTSRVLFSKLLKDEMKRKVWIAVVVLLVMILAGPVALLMRYEDYSSYMMPQELVTAMAGMFSPSMDRAVITIAIAVLLALTGFAYLFSKKQVDLYHSIPVKREKLFIISYISGVLIYTGAFLVQILTVIIAAVSKGLFTNETGMDYLRTIGGDYLHFFLIYHVTIIAVMLTGNLLVSIAASGVLLTYGLIASQILWNYSTMYFATYSSYPFTYGAVWKRVPFISPIASYIYFINYSTDYSDVPVGAQVGHMLLTLLIIVVLFFLAMYLYKKRPSEAAGKAIAYKKTEPVIRILIVILGSIMGGLLFVSLNNKPTSSWFWFGLILCGIVSHCLMEIIYRFDFKAFAGHKLQLVGCLAVAVLIGLIYRQDLLGYDTYLPDINQIQGASVAFTNVDSEMSGFVMEHIDQNGIVYGTYGDKTAMQLEDISIMDTEAVYELAKLGVERLDAFRYANGNGGVMPIAKYAGNSAAEKESESAYEEKETLLYYTVRYTLKGGRTVYRSYAVNVQSAMDAFARVYDSEEYKEGAYSILSMIDNDIFNRVEVYDVWGNKQLSLTENEMRGFLETYRKDLMKLSAETLATEVPIARLNAVYRTNGMKYPSRSDYSYEDSCSGYYIYPSFTETIAAMKKLGVYSGDMTSEIKAEDLESIKVNDCGYLNEVLGMEDQYSEGKLYVNSDTEDAALISELCENLVNSSYSWSNLVLCPFEQRIEFELLYKTKEGIQKTGYAYMKKEQIPQKIIDDLVENTIYY